MSPTLFIGEVFQPFMLLHCVKFYGTTPQDCQDPSLCHPFPHVYQLHCSAWCHLKNCWVLSIPLSVSSIKTLNSPVLTPEGRRMWLIFIWTFEPLTTALCIRPIQIIPYASNSLSTEHLPQWFSDKHVVWDCVKRLAEVKTDGISCLFLIHQWSHSIAGGHRLSQAQFALCEGHHVGCF